LPIGKGEKPFLWGFPGRGEGRCPRCDSKKGELVTGKRRVRGEGELGINC